MNYHLCFTVQVASDQFGIQNSRNKRKLGNIKGNQGALNWSYSIATADNQTTLDTFNQL